MLMFVFQLLISLPGFAQPIIVSPIPVALRPGPIVLKPEYRHLRFVAAGRKADGNYSFTHLLKTETEKPVLAAIHMSRVQNLLTDLRVHGENFNIVLAQELILGVAGIQNMDIDALIQLVMMEIAKDANTDLRQMMEEMQKNRDEKAAAREAMKAIKARQEECKRLKCSRIELVALATRYKNLQDQKDSLSELGEEQQMRLQMLMERMSKAQTMLSNILKKFSETCAQIIANIK